MEGALGRRFVLQGSVTVHDDSSQQLLRDVHSRAQVLNFGGRSVTPSFHRYIHGEHKPLPVAADVPKVSRFRAGRPG